MDVSGAREECDELALVRAGSAVADRGAAAKWVVDNVSDLGPLKWYADAPEMGVIWIDEPGRVN